MRLPMLAAALSWCALSVCLSSVAHADRVLVIGVGHYAHPQIAKDLPGIDHDVENAQRIITQLGVATGQEGRHLLQNEAATAEAIQREMRWALAASPEERVVIYFSGHGTHVKDSHGSFHSSLVAYDFQFNEDGTAQGAVLGSWIGEQLNASRAGSVLLMVDACESGTITKSMDWGKAAREVWVGPDGRPLTSIRNKYLENPHLSRETPLDSLKGIAVNPSAHWIAMSAVQANQFAQATHIGSVFTLAVWGVLSKAEVSRMSAKALREGAADYLAQHGIPVNSQPTGANPQVWGSNKQLLDAPLMQTAAAHAQGPLWTQLEHLVAESEAGTVSITGVKPRYKVGEKLSLTLTLKRNGYLTLINVDQADNAAVLIPVPDPRLPRSAELMAGTYTLPDYLENLYRKNFPMVADSPGDILLVALVSPTPLDSLKAGEPLNAKEIQGIEVSPCPTSTCKVFTTHIQDAERVVDHVTRIEAVSVRTAIVP